MQNPTLLCADDDPSLAEMICFVAAAAGFTARTTSIRNFPHSYSRFPADILVLDIFRLEKEGAELLRFLHRRHIEAKLILITGIQDNDRARACQLTNQFNLPLYAHLYKPFAPAALEDILYNLSLHLHDAAEVNVRAAHHA